MPPTDKAIWDKEIPVPVQLIQYVDQAIRDKLPPGTQVKGISPSGASYWARTAKIDAVDADGNETPFFVKVWQNCYCVRKTISTVCLGPPERCS